MAIDTNELRRKVNSTDIVDHIDLHANIKSVLSELIGRLEAAEKNLSCCQAEREEAAALFLSVKTRLAEERDTLRAKVAEMEQQEPVGTLHDDRYFVWRKIAPYQSNYAGWKTALYALPGAQPAPSVPENKK